MLYCIDWVDVYQAARRNFPQYFDPQPYFLLAHLAHFHDLQQKPKYLRRQIFLTVVSSDDFHAQVSIGHKVKLKCFAIL